MFEFCISAGKGTLLDYGVASEGAINIILSGAGPSPVLVSNGIIMVLVDNDMCDPSVDIYFRPASPDCLTAQ